MLSSKNTLEPLFRMAEILSVNNFVFMYLAFFSFLLHQPNLVFLSSSLLGSHSLPSKTMIRSHDKMNPCYCVDDYKWVNVQILGHSPFKLPSSELILMNVFGGNTLAFAI